MKKVTATVLYNPDTLQIYNLTVNHKGEFIPLIRYQLNKSPFPYKYKCFNDLYKSVLKIMRTNNFYTNYAYQFGAAFYDIAFIDINNADHISKMSYIKEV